MPEHHRDDFGVPSHGDAESRFKDTEVRLEQLSRAVTQLAEALADLAADVRRASAPAAARHVSPRRRRDTVLRVVRAFVVATVGAGLLLAAACYTQRAAAASPGHAWRFSAHPDADGDHGAMPVNGG